MLGNKWDVRYLRLAREVASWSKDPKKQVGCVLVDELHRVVSTGCNGPPAKIELFDFTAEDRLAITIHAEVNALLQKTRDFYTAYIWPVMPCSQCMAALIQAGAQRVVSHSLPSTKWRWDLCVKMCDQRNVELILCETQLFS